MCNCCVVATMGPGLQASGPEARPAFPARSRASASAALQHDTTHGRRLFLGESRTRRDATLSLVAARHSPLAARRSPLAARRNEAHSLCPRRAPRRREPCHTFRPLHGGPRALCLGRARVHLHVGEEPETSKIARNEPGRPPRSDSPPRARCAHLVPKLRPFYAPSTTLPTREAGP